MEPATVTLISTVCLITMTSLITGRYILEFGSWCKDEFCDFIDGRYYRVLINRSTPSKRFIGILYYLSSQDLNSLKNTTSILMTNNTKSNYVLIPTVGEEYWTNVSGFGKIGIVTVGTSDGTITGFQVKSINRQKLINFLNDIETKVNSTKKSN